MCTAGGVSSSTSKHISEDSYTQGRLPSSPGKLGCGAVQKGWDPEEARYGDTHRVTWAHSHPECEPHIVRSVQALLRTLEGCMCPPPALPAASIPGALHLLVLK